jgi:protein-glutamine gamma-glutamyltransferase
MRTASFHSIDRALQMHVAVLAALGAVFVGFRHETPAIPAAAAASAVIAFFLTDVLGIVRLNRWLGGGIILLAVGWSIREFLIQDLPEEKLMAIASMLCFLQVVLLFQAKTPRIFWQLIVLTALEVVVAAALDLGPAFAVLLTVYSVVSLSALTLLCIYQEVRPLDARRGQADAAAGDATWRALLAPPEVAPAQRFDTIESLGAGVLCRQVACLSVVTILFAVAFFYSAPRLRESNWQVGVMGRRAVTGFTPEVRLDLTGRVHQSRQVVMRAALSRISPERRSIELNSDPYFHGAVLSQFVPDEVGGRWLPWRPPASGERPRDRSGGIIRANPQSSSSLVRQDIILEPGPGGVRFAIMPAQPYTEDLTTAYGATPPRRETSGQPRQQRYSLVTPAILGDRQLHAIPNPMRFFPEGDRTLLDEELARCRELDAERYPRLVQTAADVIADHRLENATSLHKAEALERHFLAAGAYEYSLNLDFPRDPALNPLEDFIANHRQGTCQFFASALALMLRSQGIPARLVVGYKGGDFNGVGRYYVVEQRHAHSWVEAWVPTEEVPPTELAGLPSEGGAWYRLDPTPGRDNRILLAQEGLGTRIAQSFDYFELLWRDYVLSLNKNRQDEVVYDPLTARTAILPAWVEPRSLARWLRRFSARWGLEFGPGAQRGGMRAFEASIAVLVTGGLVMLVFAVQAGWLIWRAVRRWCSSNRGPGSAAQRPPRFYARLERLLARLPLVRASGQTPQELAALAGSRLASIEGAALTSHVPGELVRTYYRLRFGGHRLDNQEAEAIEQALAALGAAIRDKGRGQRSDVRGQRLARDN